MTVFEDRYGPSWDRPVLQDGSDGNDAWLWNTPIIFTMNYSTRGAWLGSASPSGWPRGPRNGWGRGSNFSGPTPQGLFQLARVPFNPDHSTGWKPPILGQNDATGLARNRRGVAVHTLCSYNIYRPYPTTPRYPKTPRGVACGWF